MRRLGVDVDLAPDADLLVQGSFLDREDRTWGATPGQVIRDAGAWQAGLQEAGVVAVAKHWPGHGSAPDSHLGPSTTPPLATLERRDLLPFDALAKAGVPVVMVGHLTVPGLSEPRTPASLSPAAYRYLRQRVGKGPLLMTDSLSMGAVQRGTGLTPPQAAVRALESGAEVVLVDPGRGAEEVVTEVAAAIDRGEYPRASAVAAARHLLAVKRLVRPPAPLVSLAPAAGTVRASLTPTLSALARDPLGQPVAVTFLVRSRGSARWDVANGARVTVPAGTRAAYRIAAGRLLPGRTYEWSARACPVSPPVGAACAPSTPLLSFTTRPAVL
jgi:beta-N-acetylhexosaminidase